MARIRLEYLRTELDDTFLVDEIVALLDQVLFQILQGAAPVKSANDFVKNAIRGHDRLELHSAGHAALVRRAIQGLRVNELRLTLGLLGRHPPVFTGLEIQFEVRFLNIKIVEACYRWIRLRLHTWPL